MQIIFWKILTIAAITMVLIGSAWSADKVADETKIISEKLSSLERLVGEVRRDQLNYKIEKDIIKETYSSNLETVNVVITIILGTFSILGFLGFRSIGETRKEFRDELAQFREIRIQSEGRLAEIEIQQRNAQLELEKISELNSSQDGRLKVLEIQESTSSIMAAHDYLRALDYIAIGLDISPKNETLLEHKRQALFLLNRNEEALIVVNQLLEIDPENISVHIDLCELLLIMGRFEQFSEASLLGDN